MGNPFMTMRPRLTMIPWPIGNPSGPGRTYWTLRTTRKLPRPIIEPTSDRPNGRLNSNLDHFDRESQDSLHSRKSRNACLECSVSESTILAAAWKSRSSNRSRNRRAVRSGQVTHHQPSTASTGRSSSVRRRNWNQVRLGFIENQAIGIEYQWQQDTG